MAYKDATTLAGTIVADMTEPPGEAADVAWLKNGESAVQTTSNRPHQALAENCDFLRAAINRDLGLPTVGTLTTFSGNSIDIDPSGGATGDVNYTGTLYLGESGWTGQERYDQLFQLLDENYQEVSVGGVEAKITGISGGNSLGDGFVSTLTTLDLNVTVPSGNYRIGYYEGTDLENLPPYAFTHAGLRGLEEVGGELKEHKARLEIAELTTHSGSTIVIDPTAGGGGDYDLSPAGYAYLGGSSYTGGGAEEAGFLFQVLDENYNPVVVDGTMVGVSSTSPVLGSGFYNGGVVTLTLNATLPAANYRLLLARNDNVAELADDALVKGMMRNAHRHPNYTMFTAVLTDGTNSTGGDFNGPNAIDELDTEAFGGRYLLKRGVYEWSAVEDLFKEDVSVVGEVLRWGSDVTADVTTMYVPAIISGSFTLRGQYENVCLASKSSTYSYLIGFAKLTNVNMSPGTCYINGEVFWRGGTLEHVMSAAASPTSNDAGVTFSQSAKGVVEGVTFYPPPAGSTQTAAVELSNLNSPNNTLIFKDCTFDASAVPGCHALMINVSSTKVIFDGCTFLGSDGGYCVYSSVSDVDTLEQFVNCRFYNAYGYLVYANRQLKFVDCSFETGNSTHSVTVTGVNTTTDTFTVAEDLSHLTAGDQIRIGGGANVGQWTVSSVSGTGPTDITVTEDVTNTDTDVLYYSAVYSQIFALRCGVMRECRFDVGLSNMLANTTNKYPRFEIGSINANKYPTARMSVDGLYIDCDFSDAVPRGSFVALYSTVAPGTPGSRYNDISIRGIPRANVDRLSSVGVLTAAWLEIVGELHAIDIPDRTKARCSNIFVELENGSAANGVTDSASVVSAAFCVIDGLVIDAAAAASDTSAAIGTENGVLTLSWAEVRNLSYCYYNAIVCTRADGIINVGVRGVLDGGYIRRPGVNGADLIFDLASTSVVKNFYCPDIEDFKATVLILKSTANRCSVENNTFIFDTTTASTNATALFVMSSTGRFVSNFVRIKRNENAAVTGSGGVYDSNIIDYSSGTGTPTIVDGTGVIGDNKLI